MNTSADIPYDLMVNLVGLIPPPDFVSDGCTMSPDFFPPFVWDKEPADLRPACLIHDYAYSIGGQSKQRLRADKDFYINLISCGMSRFWALVYWRRVRCMGVWFFNWGTKKPNRVLMMLLWLVGRYLMPLPEGKRCENDRS